MDFTAKKEISMNVRNTNKSNSSKRGRWICLIPIRTIRLFLITIPFLKAEASR
jgi:hypothetical protein